MTWFKTDDGFWRHRKVRRLGRAKVSVPAQVACAGLWQLAGSWAADDTSDGFVPREQVEQWDPKLQLAARLVDVDLWHETEVDGEPGYRFHDWADYNPTADEVADKRAKRAAAGRRGGVKSGETRRTKPEANASPDASSKTEAKTNPVPSPTGTYVPTGAATTERERENEPIQHAEQPHTGPGITGPRAVDAKTLVARHIGPEFPATIRTALAIEVGQLIQHYPAHVLAEALDTWKTRTGIGPRILPNLVADIVKNQNPNAYDVRVRSSVSGARSARGEKVQDWVAMGAQLQAELDGAAPFAPRLIEGGRSA